MKTGALILSFGALLAFSGCNNLTSPENAVASAYSDIQSGNLNEFLSILSNQAIKQYGTQAGLNVLQQKLAGTDPRVGDVQNLSEGTIEEGSAWTATYDVKVMSGPNAIKPGEMILDLTVDCETTLENGNPSCFGNIPTNYPACPLGAELAYSTYCSIDSIQ